ncbi:MAG: hypothetical protein HZC47_01480 [Methanobacterium sp.]|uniref:hypothetical protein n=1 Tax=Methanobacterium sp. TaxID=2164 RepID=UPI003D645E93|nr:hypothetical protein [Methanobacterium sp.]
MKESFDKEDSDKKDDKKKSTSKSMGKFLKKLDFAQVPESETKEKDKGSKSEEKSSEPDPHAFPLISDFLNSERFKHIKSGKNKIMMGIGIIVSVLLILSGIYLMMGSAEKVADNVVFGEKAVFSVFLILIGILIIATVFAYKFLNKSFFKGIDAKIESPEKESSNPKQENIKKDNINRNNR